MKAKPSIIDRLYGTYRCYRAFRAWRIPRFKAFVLGARCSDSWEFHCHPFTMFSIIRSMKAMTMWQALTQKKEPLTIPPITVNFVGTRDANGNISGRAELGN